MKKGNSHSKACMAAKTRSLDVLDATDGKSFEETIRNFMENQVFRAPKHHIVPKPTDVDVAIFAYGEPLTGKLPMIVEKYTGSHLEGKMFAAEINGRSCHCGMDFLRGYLHALEINQERV